MNRNQWMTFIFVVIIIVIILPLLFFLFFTGSAAQANRYSISDIYKCTEKSLGLEATCPLSIRSSKHIVLIAVDAFGWSTWQYAKEQGIGKNINSIAGNGTVYKAETTYPSVTRVAFPEMIPDSFFRDLKNNSISAVCIASAGFFNFIDVCSTNVLKINAKNLDKDKVAGDDDDVTMEAISVIRKNNTNFLFLHLSLDDTCHDYGPYSEQSMNDIQDMDNNIGKIHSTMKETYPDAVVIISADHGCHPTTEGGDHGSRSTEDMEIPIIIYNVS